MRHRVNVAAAAWALAAAGAAGANPPPPALDALVTYETRQVLASGVVRNERWQEQIVRRGDAVWAARVLPASALAAHKHQTSTAHAGHKHFDFEAASRLVSKDSKGETVLRYVDLAHRVVVSVPRAEYGAVGFDGRWDAAAFVVPPVTIDAMKPIAGRNAASGSRWVSEQVGAWTHRVLWSEVRQIALRVESARADGSFSRQVTVVPAARAASTVPWQGLDAFVQKEYDDFMD